MAVVKSNIRGTKIVLWNKQTLKVNSDRDDVDILQIEYIGNDDFLVEYITREARRRNETKEYGKGIMDFFEKGNNYGSR